MKKLQILITAVIFISAVGFSIFNHGTGKLMANSSGAPSGTTGSPGDGGNTCRSCHSGPSLPQLPGLITSNIPASGYIAGQTYTITCSINRPGHSKFGFQCSPQSSSGALLGSMIITNINETQLISGGKYITHKIGGTSGINAKTWSFNWVAPSGVSEVTFYGAFNATNSNNNTSGDSIFTSTMLVREQTITGLDNNYRSINGIKVFPTNTNSTINISYELDSPLRTQISIIDLQGRKVRTIFNGEQHMGHYFLTDDLSTLPNGIYLVHFSFGNEQTSCKRIIIQK